MHQQIRLDGEDAEYRKGAQGHDADDRIILHVAFFYKTFLPVNILGTTL
jgi:hypothetical protein